MKTTFVLSSAIPALALFLCSCATPVKEEDRASIHRIAVVTDLPNQLTFHSSIGFLPAFQKVRVSENSSMDVAAKAEGVVSEVLTKKGYVIVPASAELRSHAIQIIAKRFSNDTLSRLSEYSVDIDAVVFVVSQRNQGLSGVETAFGGVEVIPSKIFGTRSMLINCNTGIFIYSTASLKKIGVDVEARGGGELRDLDFHEKWEEFSPADQAKIVRQVEAALDTALRPRVEKLL